LWATYTAGKQVGSGLGDVTVIVPPDYALLMDANRRVFENPILLKEISPGLDALRLSFMAMEDREDHMLERAMPYVGYLKGLRVLFFDRSDINDADLSKVNNLPRLCYINLFLTQINGSCFAHLSTFPELYQLDVPFCHLDQKKIANLAQIRKLRYLDLCRTHMTIVGARSLSKLTGLTRLNLQQNLKFDDQCIKYLQPLKKLTWLDLRRTKVTFEGIKYLQGIKLQQLFVPMACRKKMSEIKAMFPSASIMTETGPEAVTKDDKMIYAPLK
jgi:Leucine-rich repeat (LRR) protein